MDRALLERALASKGFDLDESRDHRFYHHAVNGKRSGVWTKISTGSGYKRLDASLLGKIKRQMRLDTSLELRDFANCPMSTEDYVKKLQAKGVALE